MCSVKKIAPITPYNKGGSVHNSATHGARGGISVPFTGCKNTAVRAFCALFVLCAFSSCSLNYTSDESETPAVPEMIISNPRFCRIENGTKTLDVSASSFELFKDPSALYGSDIAFTVYEKSGTQSANGSSAFLCALTDKGEYTLLGGAAFESGAHGVTLAADTLRWNTKTEQLVTPVGSTVTVTRTLDGGGTFSATGKGFTASAFDLSFRFADGCGGVFDSE